MASVKNRQLDSRAFECIGDVTTYYAEIAPAELAALLGEFTVHNVYTGSLTDGLGGLLERSKERTIEIHRNGKRVWTVRYAMPRDVWAFIAGVACGRRS